MNALARVLFHVQARNADALRPAVRRRHLNPAMLSQRLVELRNLVALGQVGIEVVLPRENRPLAHLAVDRQRSQRGKLHRLGIQHRQRAGQPQAHRANVGVGRGAKLVGTAAKRLAGGQQLHVHFKADYRLVLGQNLWRKRCGGHESILARSTHRSTSALSATPPDSDPQP